MTKTLFLLAICITVSHANRADAYYGTKSTEAVLRFETEVNVPWQEAIPTTEMLNQEGEVRTAAVKLADAQILHLDGVFHTEQFAGRQKNGPKDWIFGGPASCGPWYEHHNYNIEFTDVKTTDEAGRIILKYKFAGQIVVDREAFGPRGKTVRMPVWLPIQPDLIYENDIKWKKNQCTDKVDDNTPGSYYYYWDPWMQYCSLQTDSGQKVNWINAEVERMSNDTGMAPDYDRLYTAGKGQSIRVLNIAHFIGYISHHIRPGHPSWKDEALYEFRRLESHLTGTDKDDLAFQVSTKEGENISGFRTDVATNEIIKDDGPDIYRVYEKDVTGPKGDRLHVRISVLVAGTAVEDQEPSKDPKFGTDKQEKDKVYDPTFENFYKRSVQNADIIMYDGHSGDGDNLSPEKLGYTLPENKYLVLFINGCDSYINYLGQFLATVPENKATLTPHLGNLDIVMSSTPIYNTEFAGNAIAFLDYFLTGQRASYKDIIDDVEDSNHFAKVKTYGLPPKHYPETFLVGVKQRGEIYNRKPSIDRK